MTLRRKLTISVIAIVVSTAAVIAVVAERSVRSSLAPVSLARQVEWTGNLLGVVERRVVSIGRDSLVARRSIPAKEVLASPRGEAWDQRRAEVVRMFSALLQTKPEYLQMRLIGRADGGREVVRIERSAQDGSIRDVPEAELQRKGERPYLQDALKLADGEVQISGIELNQEHGVVQIPRIAVLRAATPVIGDDGVAVGAIVIFADMGGSLDILRRQAPRGVRLYLVNEAGEFLLHPDRARELTSDAGRPGRIQDDLPALADILGTKEPRTRWIDEPGLGVERVAAVPVRLAGAVPVTLFTVIPEPSSITWTVQSPILVSALLLALVSATLALFLARSIASPLTRMTAMAERFAGGGDDPLPVESSGEIGVLARALRQMASDVRRDRAALMGAEQQLRRVLEAVPSAMLVVDAKARVVLVNRRTEELFGYDRARLIGEELNLLLPERDRAKHPALVDSFFAEPSARRMGVGRELFGRRADGTEVPVEIGLSPVQMPDGLCTLASIIDVSERRQRDEELKRSNAELEQFAYVASHDLQEPLRMVANYTELLAERYRGKLDAKADRYIHFASDGARRMQRLVTDLLAYSRVGSQGKEMRPVASGAVLDRVVASLGQLVRETSASIVRGDLPVVAADEVQLTQLFQNLLGNALKFRSAEPPRVEIAAVLEAGLWRFSVKDNGIGMDMKYAERIFQMFRRLHEIGRYEGSGIGLAIAKRIVERHGGRLWVEAAPGAGSTFHFTMQASKKE